MVAVPDVCHPAFVVEAEILPPQELQHRVSVEVHSSIDVLQDGLTFSRCGVDPVRLLPVPRVDPHVAFRPSPNRIERFPLDSQICLPIIVHRRVSERVGRLVFAEKRKTTCQSPILIAHQTAFQPVCCLQTIHVRHTNDRKFLPVSHQLFFELLPPRSAARVSDRVPFLQRGSVSEWLASPSDDVF